MAGHAARLRISWRMAQKMECPQGAEAALLGLQQPQFFGLTPDLLDCAGPTEETRYLFNRAPVSQAVREYVLVLRTSRGDVDAVVSRNKEFVSDLLAKKDKGAAISQLRPG
jgi:hypothetical protein